MSKLEMSSLNRIIVLVDMDCFYCQVEEKLNPYLAGKPIAVVQYNAWRGGGTIAVNYPAREKGVTRHMRGNEAKKKCPEIILARVPEVRGKADLTKYREAGKEVAEVLKTFTPILERASVDEAYLDITDVVNKRMNTDFEKLTAENLKNSYVVGWDIEDFIHNIHQNKEYTENNCRLAMGGLIAEEIRAAVYKRTGYRCSAGIAHNKILAKVVCGLHKPNRQTLLPQESVPELYKDLPIKKVNSLGGKFGDTLTQKLNVTNMGELYKFSEKELVDRFDGKTGNWLYNIARGLDFEPVSIRLVSKSIGCCKTFPGRSALVTPESVFHWISQLALEITERLEKDLEENNRRAKQMVINFAQEINGKDVSSSRTVQLISYDQNKIAQSGMDTLKKFCLKSDGTYSIKLLGISAGNFEENKKRTSITTFFQNMKNSRNFENSNENNINFQDSNKIEDVGNTSCSFLQQSQINNNYPYLQEEIVNVDITNEDNYDEDTSVYSATTEDLNEDIKSLIYYEDIYPESVASQPILEKKCTESIIQDVQGNQISSDDSNTNNEILGIRESSSNSFFTKYFESSIDKSTKAPERNFDTSKILETDSSDDISDKDKSLSQSISMPKNNQFNFTLETDGDENKEKEETVEPDLRETCLECNKKILPWELVSHMDYHYALKMVKNEAHLYKPTPTILPKINFEKKVTANQGVKRKVSKVKDTVPIHAFLRKEELNDENSTFCDECNKRINFEEIVSHADYHAAKKLHLEINSRSMSNESKIGKTSSKIKSRSKKSVVGSTSIESFFHP